MAKTAVIVVSLRVNPDYPTRPGQPPLVRALEEAVWNGLRHTDLIADAKAVEVRVEVR